MAGKCRMSSRKFPNVATTNVPVNDLKRTSMEDVC